MLKLDSTRIESERAVAKPQRQTKKIAELNALWPKVRALKPGELLVVPYDGGGKKWTGISYVRMIRGGIERDIKGGGLRGTFDVWRDNENIYVSNHAETAVGSEPKPARKR